MQFVLTPGYFISFSLVSALASELRNHPLAFYHTIYKTEQPLQPHTFSLQECTLLAAKMRGKAQDCPAYFTKKKSSRNYHREPGLHSPAHQLPYYSTPIAIRLCRAVQAGSGSHVNLRNPFGFQRVLS
jgi:hypothetical protein